MIATGGGERGEPVPLETAGPARGGTGWVMPGASPVI